MAGRPDYAGKTLKNVLKQFIQKCKLAQLIGAQKGKKVSANIFANIYIFTEENWEKGTNSIWLSLH